jgi:hypothetical protein
MTKEIQDMEVWTEFIGFGIGEGCCQQCYESFGTIKGGISTVWETVSFSGETMELLT